MNILPHQTVIIGRKCVPGQDNERAMSDVELEYFRFCTQTPFETAKYAAGQVIGVWFLISLAVMCIWLLVDWVGRVTLGIDIWRDSGATAWVLSLGATGGAIYSVFSIVRRYKRVAGIDSPVRADLEKKEATPGQVNERAMTEAEQAHFLFYAQTRLGRLIPAVVQGFAIWFGTLLLVVVAWLAVSWLVRATIGIDFGTGSGVGPWVLSLGSIACGIYSVISSVHWFNLAPHGDSLVRVDKEKKQAVEEKYEISAAMRMQEQEHGGLVYFLRSSDGTVLAFFDYESQDLGTNGEDPLTSSFRPRTRLTLVRAAKSGLVIGTNFSGDVVDAGDPLDLMAPPEEWPDFEEICDIPWQELEARFCR